MKKPLTARQISNSIEKRKVIRRKNLASKILAILNLHIKLDEGEEDIIHVLSSIIRKLTK